MKKSFLIGAALILSAYSMDESAKDSAPTPVTEAAAAEVLTDTLTKLDIETVKVTENMKLVEWLSDAMDRGNHDYDTSVHGNLVVEPGYQNANRGDIVYFKTPDSAVNDNPNLPEHYIARVVGLPGETVEIRDGQVYVDDKKLDAFYGVARDTGLNKDEYFELLDKNLEEGTWTADEELSEKELITWVNTEGKEEYFATSMEAVRVSGEAVFVLVDQWWRGTDSRDFGELPLEVVEGKVLGYEK